MKRGLTKYVNFVSSHFLAVSVLSCAVSSAYHYLTCRDAGHSVFLGWKASQFYVDYFTFGFVKRGLVGTVFAFWDKTDIATLAVLITAVSSLLVFVAVDRFCDRTTDTGRIVRALVAVSPFTAFQFIYDMGRYDVINAVIFIAAVVAVLRFWVVPAAVMCCVGTLVHEAFFVYAFPVVLALAGTLFWRADAAGRHRRIVPLVLLAALPAAVALLVLLHGNDPEVVAYAPGPGTMVWRRGLLDLSFARHGSGTDFVMCVIMLLIMYAWLIRFYRTNGGRCDWLFAAGFAPLALFVLGTDYARWSALVFFVLLTIVVIKSRIDGWSMRPTDLRYGMFVFLVPLGPVGVDYLFPVLRYALGLPQPGS